MTCSVDLKCADSPPHQQFHIFPLYHHFNEEWGEMRTLIENHKGKFLTRFPVLCIGGWASQSSEATGVCLNSYLSWPLTMTKVQASFCRDGKDVKLPGCPKCLSILLTFHSDDICVSANVSKSTYFGRKNVIFPFMTVLRGIVQCYRLSNGALTGTQPRQNSLLWRRQIVN
jgi:hypothetical protein